MQISSSSAASQTQSPTTLPKQGDALSNISDQYQALNPEQQRNVDIKVNDSVGAYQNQEQMKRDFQRNATLSVNNYQHQNSLKDIYLNSSDDDKNSSSSLASSTLESVNQTIENGQKTQRQLAVAEFYYRFGGGQEVTTPVEPSQPEVTPYASSVSIAV